MFIPTSKLFNFRLNPWWIYLLFAFLFLLCPSLLTLLPSCISDASVVSWKICEGILGTTLEFISHMEKWKLKSAAAICYFDGKQFPLKQPLKLPKIVYSLIISLKIYEILNFFSAFYRLPLSNGRRGENERFDHNFDRIENNKHISNILNKNSHFWYTTVILFFFRISKSLLITGVKMYLCTLIWYALLHRNPLNKVISQASKNYKKINTNISLIEQGGRKSSLYTSQFPPPPPSPLKIIPFHKHSLT